MIAPNIQNEGKPSSAESLPVTTSATEGDATQMTQPVPKASVPGLQSLIEKAKEDLAQRLTISINEIILLETTSVVWPDASLGCPQPGMTYAQMLTPGYLILVEASGKIYEYHANKATYVIFCENPSSPVPGLPGDI
jgi:hypothetical protein